MASVSARTPVSRANPGNKRAQRALKKREPQLVEECKNAFFMRGRKSSQAITSFLSDLHRLRKPESVLYKRNNDLLPFENEASLEFFAHKCDAGLFAFGSHSKKRPNNLIMGRFYDSHLLDMFELTVQNYVALDQVAGSYGQVGCKPCLIFSGAQWDTDATYKSVANGLLDFFRGRVVDAINLAGLDRVLTFTIDSSGKILMRQYAIVLHKSGGQLPRVELEDCGPNADLVVGRTKFAAPDLWKHATKQPKQLTSKPPKNISTNALKDRIGTIHMQHQDLNKMATRKYKGLKTKGSKRVADADAGGRKRVAKSSE